MFQTVSIKYVHYLCKLKFFLPIYELEFLLLRFEKSEFSLFERWSSFFFVREKYVSPLRVIGFNLLRYVKNLFSCLQVSVYTPNL